MSWDGSKKENKKGSGLVGYQKDLVSQAHKKKTTKKTNWEDFHSVYDFRKTKLHKNTAIGELYKLSKLGILLLHCYTETHIANLTQMRTTIRTWETSREKQRQADSSGEPEPTSTVIPIQLLMS